MSPANPSGRCTFGNEEPDTVLGTQAGYNSFVNILTPNQRYFDEETTRAGFKNHLMFNSAVVLHPRAASGVHRWYCSPVWPGCRWPSHTTTPHGTRHDGRSSRAGWVREWLLRGSTGATRSTGGSGRPRIPRPGRGRGTTAFGGPAVPNGLWRPVPGPAFARSKLRHGNRGRRGGGMLCLGCNVNRSDSRRWLRRGRSWA